MDEYDSAEAFCHMQRIVQEQFKGAHAGEQNARHAELESLMVPGSQNGPTLYGEIPSARIEFESYQICADALARAEAAAK